MFFLPKPLAPSRHYLFHQFWPDHIFPNLPAEHAELRYSLIEPNANQMPEVTESNVVLVDSITMSGMQACRHANGRDWWILAPSFGSTPGFHRVLLDSQGVQGPWLQVLPQDFETRIPIRGQAVFSPDGSLYARIECTRSLEVFDFDRCTGLVSNLRRVTLQDTCKDLLLPSGAAFSPSGRYLYAATGWHLYQFDTWAPDLEASKTLIATTDPYPIDTNSIFMSLIQLLQLAPDGKIYAGGAWPAAMHVIHEPDSGGTACQFVPSGFSYPALGGGNFIRLARPFPPFPHAGIAGGLLRGARRHGCCGVLARGGCAAAPQPGP